MLHISELTDTLLTDLCINTTTNPKAVIQQWTLEKENCSLVLLELLFRSWIFIDAARALGHNSYFYALHFEVSRFYCVAVFETVAIAVAVIVLLLSYSEEQKWGPIVWCGCLMLTSPFDSTESYY